MSRGQYDLYSPHQGSIIIVCAPRASACAEACLKPCWSIRTSECLHPHCRDEPSGPPVCTENFVRVEAVTEAYGMIGLPFLLLDFISAPFRSKIQLAAENAALRHQLMVLRRKSPRRVRLTNGDRWIFILLYRCFPSILQILTIVRPETVIRWHRAGLGRYRRWRSRDRGGRPTRHNPADQLRKSALGCITFPRRAAQTGF